ncbi:uncharacterized protein LAESUDRAFT_85143 [Laetiporus sulphureus 93-53]|uniref:Uncharacterized protein n=1 Tax=Laetiporus sulphureus 93-53 TaxID=1314785 RepID=A0A165AVB1_9APHY|nr:uncharacterized protein LAESUDRAFT_85143 [Laetiporus sulphureus 93-53]KZS99732.1 hypothetical protein LAESUDRAFT_85143 [Laetiporus sulphureus 93-53]
MIVAIQTGLLTISWALADHIPYLASVRKFFDCNVQSGLSRDESLQNTDTCVRCHHNFQFLLVSMSELSPTSSSTSLSRKIVYDSWFNMSRLNARDSWEPPHVEDTDFSWNVEAGYPDTLMSMVSHLCSIMYNSPAELIFAGR